MKKLILFLCLVSSLCFAQIDSTTASNGLTEVGNDIRWGGTLTQSTLIDGNFDLSIALPDMYIDGTNSLGFFAPDVTVGGQTNNLIWIRSNGLLKLQAPTITIAFLPSDCTGKPSRTIYKDANNFLKVCP